MTQDEINQLWMDPVNTNTGKLTYLKMRRLGEHKGRWSIQLKYSELKSMIENLRSISKKYEGDLKVAWIDTKRLSKGYRIQLWIQGSGTEDGRIPCIDSNKWEVVASEFRDALNAVFDESYLFVDPWNEGRPQMRWGKVYIEVTDREEEI